MKNKSLLPILIATFALTACALPNPSKSEDISSEAPTSEVSSIDPVSSSEIPVSSSEAPSSTPVSSSSVAPSSSEAPVTYGVAIANKTAFGEWYAGATRDLDINLTPAANVLSELNKKNLTVTSSNPEVVKVQGVSLAALKAGTAKITVAYYGATDTLDVTILDNSAKAKYGVDHEGTADDPFTNEEAIKVTKSEKYEGEDYYVGGIVESFYHAPGSRTDGVVSYYLTPATAGGEKFEVYKCVKEDGSYLTDDDIWKGGYAVAHGPFTTYNSQCETSSAKFLSCEGNKPDAKKTIETTFADAFAVGAALSDGDSTYDFYKFTGYVTKKSGNNFFLTATKGEEIVKGKSDAAHGERDYDTNAIELYFATAPSADITAKLLQDAKVTVTMSIKNYHGEVENSNVLTADDIIVVEAGQNWAVPEPEVTTKTLAEFIAGENTKTKAYIVTADIKAFKSASTKDAYGNMTLTDGTNDLVIYGASATASALAWDNAESYAFTNPKDFMTNEVTKDLAIGQTLKMKLIRADYTDTKTGTTTIEGTGIILEVTGQGQQQEEVPEPTVTTKTLAEFIALENKADKAYEVTAQLKSFKNGSLANDKYGNLVVTDGTNDLVVYGSTATASALVWNKADAYVFTNPQDFQTNDLTKDIAIGQTLKMKLIRADYGTTKQANAIILEVSGNPSEQEEVPEPAVDTKTLAEFIALENKADKAYSVKANIKAFKSGSTKDAYGNMTLTDGANDLVIYGSTMSASALAWNKSNAYVFTNPKDFMTTAATNALQIGNEITMKLIRADYTDTKTGTTTIEGTGVITAITPVAATSINLDKATAEVEVGANINLTATVAPADCNQPISWSSSNETVATVENGKVTAIAVGTTKIKATVGSFEAECAVTVAAPEAGVEKATLAYTGTTTGNMAATGNADKVGLDASLFAVDSSKGETSNLPGLNKSQYIALYSKKAADATGVGSSFTVTIASGYVIKSITIDFKQNGTDAKVYAGNTVVTGVDNVYEINGSSFKVENAYKSDGSANNQVQINKIDIKYAAAAPVEEIAQPVGSYNGYAIATDDSNIFSNIALGDSKAYVEIGTYAKGIFDFTFDKTTGLLSIALGGVLGNLTVKYDAKNDKLVEGKVDGAGATALKNNGSIELAAAKFFADCNGATGELQALFNRRYGDPWTVDTTNPDRFVSDDNGIAGKGMKVRSWTGGRYAINLGADFSTAIEVSSIGFWVYNSGEKDVTLRMWIYKAVGLQSNAEIGSVTAKAGGWSYCRMGFNKAAIYNFQIADFTNTGTALVFDNICLF